MTLTKEQAKNIYILSNIPCSDICETFLYNNDDAEISDDSICGLCYRNNQQLFIPKDEYVNGLQKILE